MNTIGAHIVNNEEQKERESIKANVKVDIAVVLPLIPESEESDIQLELDYDTITKVVNDYVKRYTIDPRIDEIEYDLSTPKLPDNIATKKLKEVLTGETCEIESYKENIKVDNKAIVDEKVTLTFKLSVEENVYINENADAEQQKQGLHQPEKISQQNANSVPSTKSPQPINNQPEDELIIQSPNSQLFWQNDSSSQLYWQNAFPNVSPPSNTSQYNNTLSTEDTLDTVKTIGSGLQSGMESTKTIEHPNLVSRIFKQKGGYVKVGDNGQVYTNPYARGNKYYKIAGDFSKNKYVKGLGIFGKVVNYGTTVIQTGIDYSQAETSQEKGRVVGASVGKVFSGTIAVAVASWTTSAVLITIAGALGVASAPITIVIIAGASIITGVLASNMVENHGEELGGNIGEKAVEYWQNKENIENKEELGRKRAKMLEEQTGTIVEYDQKCSEILYDSVDSNDNETDLNNWDQEEICERRAYENIQKDSENNGWNPYTVKIKTTNIEKNEKTENTLPSKEISADEILGNINKVSVDNLKNFKWKQQDAANVYRRSKYDD